MATPFEAQIERLVDVLTKPASYLFDPAHRLYWPFLAGTLVLALIHWVARRGFAGPGMRALVSPRIWLHPSSRLDVGLLLVKPLIHVYLFAPWLLSSLALGVAIVGWLESWIGPTVSFGATMPDVAVRVSYTLALFLAWDASRYAVHRLAHEIPPLWELHKVHHSAQVMTPLTLYRSHPLESLIFHVRGVVVTGSVSGIFYYLFRDRALQYDLVGVSAIGFVLNLLGGNLRHSHVWFRYPGWVERILISPAQHQTHHSAVLEECHSNYGSFLAVWDWAGGSLRTSAPLPPDRFGLPDEELNHRPDGLLSALFGPIVAMARRCTRGARSSPSPHAIQSGVSCAPDPGRAGFDPSNEAQDLRVAEHR